jgi:DNA adenine methylase
MTIRKASAPIKWHGGKSYLAGKIIDLMPRHTHYVEPFFGGGAVLFNKPPSLIEGHSEVVNDIYGELVNFWKVLQSAESFPEFRFRLSLIPFSKPHFDEALNSSAEDPLERAIAFFVRFRQSRQGLGRVFATMSRTRTRRGMNEQVSSWLSAIEGLDEAHGRLQRVVIFNEDAIQLIRREDDPESFFYCDPPYLPETRAVKNAYSFEMDDKQHEDLLAALGNLKGKFLLSGYPHRIYQRAAERHGWRCVEIEIDNKASSLKTKPTKIECLWMNY